MTKSIGLGILTYFRRTYACFGLKGLKTFSRGGSFSKAWQLFLGAQNWRHRRKPKGTIKLTKIKVLDTFNYIYHSKALKKLGLKIFCEYGHFRNVTRENCCQSWDFSNFDANFLELRWENGYTRRVSSILIFRELLNGI